MALLTPVTKPTLVYSHFAGLAEPARLLLEDAGVDYDYVAVTNWDELKVQLQAIGKAPFGQKPVYEEPSGLCIAQSAAILRHLARQHGYYGQDASEAARIDQAAEGVVDVRHRLAQDVFNRSSTEEQKAKTKAQFLSDYLPGQFDIFSKLIERNGDSGYLVGSKVSHADLLLWNTLDLTYKYVEGSEELAAKYPTIKSFHARVAGRDRIKAYLARDVYATKE